MDDVPDEYLDALRDVYDPCCREKGISVVDMGLVRSVSVPTGTPGSSCCSPRAGARSRRMCSTEVRDRISALPGVGDAEVEIVWDEAWTTDRLCRRPPRAQLRFLPDPSQVARPRRYVSGPHEGGRHDR